MTVQDTVNEAITRMKEAKEKAILSISGTLKTIDPKLDGVENRGNISIVNSSALTKDMVLDPFTYDVQRQIDFLIKFLQKSSLATFMLKVEDIIDSKGWKAVTIDGTTVRFHPRFVEQLKKVTIGK